MQLDKAMMALAMTHPPIPAQLNSLAVKPLRSDREDSNVPTLPPAMPELDPEDYPCACYWMQSSWTEYKKKQTNQGFTVYGLDFMHDKDGKKISDEQLSAMTKHAKQLWNTLYRYHQDPSSWGKKTDFEANFFSQHMHLSFPKFGLCKGSWKAEAFAIIRYPDWSSKVRNSGTILCAFFFILLSNS